MVSFPLRTNYGSASPIHGSLPCRKEYEALKQLRLSINGLPLGHTTSSTKSVSERMAFYGGFCDFVVLVFKLRRPARRYPVAQEFPVGVWIRGSRSGNAQLTAETRGLTLATVPRYTRLMRRLLLQEPSINISTCASRLNYKFGSAVVARSLTQCVYTDGIQHESTVYLPTSLQWDHSPPRLTHGSTSCAPVHLVDDVGGIASGNVSCAVPDVPFFWRWNDTCPCHAANSPCDDSCLVKARHARLEVQLATRSSIRPRARCDANSLNGYPDTPLPHYATLRPKPAIDRCTESHSNTALHERCWPRPRPRSTALSDA